MLLHDGAPALSVFSPSLLLFILHSMFVAFVNGHGSQLGAPFSLFSLLVRYFATNGRN